MSKGINGVAKLLRENFENNTVNGTHSFVTCSEGVLKDFIREVHDGQLPDNFIYQTIQSCIEAVAEGRNDIAGVLEDVTADIYTEDLIKWSSSNLNRISIINDVLSEYQIEDFNELLQHAQTKEIEEICYATLGFLESQVEHTLTNNEEYDYE